MTSARGIELRDIFAARRRLKSHVIATPLRRSDWLSALTDAEVQLKLECLQQTHSFKLRGAMNAALCLIEAGTAPTIVTASAGNHGRGVALAASRLGLRAEVFTPHSAPETKKAAIRRLGVALHDDAPDYDTAEQRAREHASASGGIYISPYNHRDVIAGAGTIGIELLESAPDLDVVVVPLGGGGLASGVAIAMKQAAPHITIVGVEVEASRAFSTSLARGRITEVEVKPSLADGLIGNLEPGSMTFDLVRRHVDRVVSVSEDDVKRAVRGLISEEHVVAEGAGAAATAAVLRTGVVTGGQRAAVLVTGGNIDVGVLRSVLAADG